MAAESSDRNILDIFSVDTLCVVLSFLDILDDHTIFELIRDPDVRKHLLKVWKANTKYTTTVEDVYVGKQLVTYRVNGKIHRTSGPAIHELPDRKMFYEFYFNDQLHCDNGPAVVDYRYAGVVERYYKRGVLHRIGGPAVYYVSPTFRSMERTEEYWVGGVKHRPMSEGPAIVDADDDKYEFWEHGVQVFPHGSNK